MKTRFSALMIAAIAVGTWQADCAQAQTTSTSSSSSSSYSSSTGPGGSSYSSSSSSISLKDTPLIESLATASQTARTAFFLSQRAAEVVNASSHKVTISERNLSSQELLARILSGTGLVPVPIGANVCILTADDSIEELHANVAAAIEAKTEQVKGLIPFAQLQLAHARASRSR